MNALATNQRSGKGGVITCAGGQHRDVDALVTQKNQSNDWPASFAQQRIARSIP